MESLKFPAKSKPTFMAYKVIGLFKANPTETFTVAEVANELGIWTAPARLHVQYLWFLKLVHIAEWDRTPFHITPTYKWGSKKDAPKPEPRTHAQIAKRYRERKKLAAQSVA